MPVDAHLADLMRMALEGRRGITEKKMFGGICWMHNGNMLCGARVGRFMFRVGVEQEVQALSRPGASPIVMAGKTRRGFVRVDADEAIETGLRDWIDLAARYVGSLPPK
jgi:TfoX/Sxy family transcriptional regulator of competence genes